MSENAVGAEFPISVKINSSDFQRGGLTEEESLRVIKYLDDLGIDLLEISGGTYERAAMFFIECQGKYEAARGIFY